MSGKVEFIELEVRTKRTNSAIYMIREIGGRFCPCKLRQYDPLLPCAYQGAERLDAWLRKHRCLLATIRVEWQETGCDEMAVCDGVVVNKSWRRENLLRVDVRINGGRLIKLEPEEEELFRQLYPEPAEIEQYEVAMRRAGLLMEVIAEKS